MLIVATYHYVRPSFDFLHAGIHGITPSALETQLCLLNTLGEFVSAQQVLAAARGDGPLPERALLVTFDDGLREQVDWALPVLDRIGVPALFFVNTWPIANRAVSTVHKIHFLRAHLAPAELSALLHAEARRHNVEVRLGIDPADAAVKYPWDAPESAQLKYFLNHQLAHEVRDALIAPCFHQVFGENEAAISSKLYMSVEQLRTLGARGYLGTHGDQHLPLGRLSWAAAHENVRLSLDALAHWTGVRPFALSYPFGSPEASSAAAGAAAAAAGVQLAFTMERTANVDLSQPLHLARFDCNDLPGGSQPCFAVESLFEAIPAARWHR